MKPYSASTQRCSRATITPKGRQAKHRRILTRSVAALLAALGAENDLYAQSGTWNVNASGNWSGTANWAGAVIADGTDNTANFTFNINATRTVTLDSARTIGNLVFQDLTTSSNDWALASSNAANILTLDVTAGMAGIRVLNRTATISAVLAGNDGILVSSATSGTTGGTLILSGANTFTGGLTITGGIVQLNNALAAGNNVITVAASANTGIANRVAVNGGVTIANDIIIAAGAAPVAGRGALEQAGTGQATINGTVTVQGGTANGGHFIGGAAVGNELVLNGALNVDPVFNTGTIAQREGRVIYKGGGNYQNLMTTGAVILGADNGIAPGANLIITFTNAGSAGSLQLNNFNQTLGNLNIAGGSAGTITTGTGVLTLNGNFSSSGNFSHVFNGLVDLGGGTRVFTVNNGSTAIDLQAGASFANGAIDKAGTGTIQLTGNSTLTGLNIFEGTVVLGNNVLDVPLISVTGGMLRGSGSISGAIDVAPSSTLAPGSMDTAGTITTGALNLTGASITALNVGAESDLINVTELEGFSTNAGAILKMLPNGALGIGTTDLIRYSGTIQGSGFAGLTLAGVGHATANLVDTGTAVRLNVTQVTDTIIWKGPTGAPGSGNWDSDPANEAWTFQTAGTPASYLDGDLVRFEDLTFPTATAVNLAGTMTPAQVVVDNTSLNPYTFTGAGISGPTELIKEGTGTLILQNANTYTGQTSVKAGTLELDFDGGALVEPNNPAGGTSGVTVEAGSTFLLSRNDGGFTFDRAISGAGTVEVNPHSFSGGTAAHSVFLTGNNSELTGTLRLVTPATGTYRIQGPQPAALGTASIEVQSGAQLYTAANQVYQNSLSIEGTGFTDANGNIGALRLEPGSNWAGPITVNGFARIGSHNGTATVSGNISGGDLSVNATNYNNSYTLIFSGTNSYNNTVIGGQNTQTAGVPSMRLNIGAGGTTGTLGSGTVTINGDGANGVLGFDRSDGYALLAGQTITGAGSTLTRTFIDIDTRGAGFSDNGNAITLGAAGIGTGGTIRIAQARANSIANITGSLTAERILVSSAQTGGVLNIGIGGNVSANYLSVGEIAGASGTVNQAAGSSVTVTGQVRVGHFSTNTSVYNLNGGTLELTGATPNNNPSTADPGSTTVIGDNNLNLTNPTTIVGGGIYLGIDGTGIFNHNAGAVTTNWIVLDNRGNTGIGANTPDGIDRYNLNDGVLNLRSSYGLIQRNASAAVTFAGGVVRVDNTGIGINTGPNLNIPLDADITVSGTEATLDTNGAGNAFTLPRTVLGDGILTFTGGGTINLSSATFQNVNANLASVGLPTSLVKLGAGTTSLNGSAGLYTGPITVTAGRLNLPTTVGASSVTVGDGAAIGGEPAVASLVFGTTTGSTLFIDPNTSGALTAGTLTSNGTATIDFATAPTGAGPYTVANYGAIVGTPAPLALANAANYRGHVFNTATPGTITLDVTTKDLTWAGGIDANWNQNATANWNAGADTFFAGDRVTFGDGPTQLAITVGNGVSPFRTTVNSSTNSYTFTSAGVGIAGAGNLEKSGESTLTLIGANSYTGRTIINGGTVAIAAATSLGNGSQTNGIALNGGRLLYTANAALDLGAMRSIEVGGGGGTIAHSGTTNAAITIPGNFIGSTDLKFSTTGTSGTVSTATNYSLTGGNSAFTGTISVEATGNILSTLTFANQNAVPNASSITVSYPAASVTNTNATTLALPGVTLPIATTLNMISFTSGGISRRAQVASSGNSTINGPIALTGNAAAVVQFSPANGTLTIEGDISESSPDSFGTSASRGIVFFRNAGNTVINGRINLPNALISRVDDTGTTTINSTGNIWSATDVRSNSTLRLGVSNALPAGATMTIGQTTDGSSSVFEMNGFDQTVAGLISTAGNAANNRRVTNSSTTLSTLTLDGTTDRVYGNSTGNTGGNITGNVAIIKNGTYSQTFAGPANTYTGNVTVNNGTLVAGGVATSTALGSPTTAGRVITVNAPGTLSFTTNNVFGNGVNNNNLPTTILNGATLSSTRYNVLGNVALSDATLTQAATDSGAFEGYQFRGAVDVGGSSLSTIATTNDKANHLGPNTVFNVADATATPDVDLLISAPLRDQSGDFGQAAGGLTKNGPGTMELSAVSSYTGPTVIDGGTLMVSGSISGSAVTVNAGGLLGGEGTVGAITVLGGVVAPGNSFGTLTTGAVSLNADSFLRFDLVQAGTVGGVNDLLNITGNFTLDGTLEVIDLPGFTTGSYRLANYTGGTLTNNGLLLDPTFLASYPGSFVDVGTPGELNLVVVPEPASSAVLLSGLALLVSVARRRPVKSA